MTQNPYAPGRADAATAVPQMWLELLLLLLLLLLLMAFIAFAAFAPSLSLFFFFVVFFSRAGAAFFKSRMAFIASGAISL